ncbi:hypothetical protein N657DRAFT_308637 [Parathielavia appendiculata]|uniref:Uncharacterized protein n=1 Tax=Parathielavia appendiculata TaxID=2587402 RepID=A0AAN6Z6J3_9PEZI|nr:hypothetical protein N657DRAFT_308637 [Parathielavia appendiculata]
MGIWLLTAGNPLIPSTNSSVPFCGTIRYGNDFMQFYCKTASHSLTGTAYFTSAGETAAWPGIPRLTGKNGPKSAASSQAAVPVTVQATETATSNAAANAGALSAEWSVEPSWQSWRFGWCCPSGNGGQSGRR